MFGDLVRAHRRRLGLTQEGLAERVGLSVRSIGNLETGAIDAPRSTTVRLLADAFCLAGAERDRFCQIAAGQVTPAPAVVPAQLPSDVSGFVGRDEQLARLEALVGAGPDRSTAVVISAIAGTAGVGKTALAVRWAHRVRERFPDGQLYVNLRGYDPDEPVAAADALGRFLTALGVPGPDIPFGVDERAARYRTQVAGRRMLVVLDNAASVEQVRPLLPGSPSCAVVVTSRDSLAGLVAMHGARRIDLDLLPPADATTLLRSLIGPRVDADLDAAGALAQLCARLPLALRVVAEFAISRPTIPLADLVSELADQQRRLDLLDADGDPRAAVTVVFSWSIRHLPADAARTFRRLGLHPGPDLDQYAAAALTGTDLRLVRHALAALVRAHLIHPTTAGRYGMHDLLRAYAAQLSVEEDAAGDRTAAVDRLLDHYRHTAAVAMDAAYPYERERRPHVPPARTPGPDLSDAAPAFAWLDTELPNLLAATRYAAEHDRPAHVLHLSGIVHWHLRSRCRYHDAENLHRHALATARTTGDQAGETDALAGLGHVHRLRGRHPQAIDHFEQALRIGRVTGHHTGEMDALTGLARIHRLQGRYAQAIDHFGQALRIARVTGHHTGELSALNGLGRIHWMQGRYAQASDHYGQALRIAWAMGHHIGEIDALAGLGQVHWVQGRYAWAIDHFGQAARIARAIGHHYSEMGALAGLGQVHRLQGQYTQSTAYYQQLLDLAQKHGHINFQFEAWQGLGRLRHATDDPAAAITHHDKALALAHELHQPGDQARAHDGLAHAHYARGQHEQARRHWQHALDILTHLGLDRTDDVEATITTIRTRLSALPLPC